MKTFIALLSGLLLLVPLTHGQAQSLEWQRLRDKARWLHEQGDYGQAVLLAKEALGLAEKEAASDPTTHATSLTHLGDIYKAQGDYAKAEWSYKRALAILEKSFGPDHPDVDEILTKLGDIYKAQGDYVEAERSYKRALAIREKSDSRDYIGKAAILTNLGDIYKAQGDHAEAEQSYKHAEQSYKQHSLAIRESLRRDHLDVAVAKVERGADKRPEPKSNGNGDEKPARGDGGNGDNEIPSSIKLEEYKVVLGADASIKMPGLPGELRVWIGGPDVDPKFPRGMTAAPGSLPAIGETAKVTPFAPAFEIEPTESICMTIDPTGSAVRFTLKPKKIGTFNVGADVQLFRSNNCSGAPVPKATETLQVQVIVNTEEKLQERTKQLGEVFWTKFLDFWGLFVALVFALLLFLIRGRLKKWFSFGNDS